MNFEVIPTPDFERSFKNLAKRHRSLKADFRDFKSGGARVITYTVMALEASGEVYLLDIYDKNDFSTVDVPTLLKIVKDLGISRE